MFTAEDDIRLGVAPVIIASGDNAFAALTKEMKKYIAKAKPGQLYALSKVGDHLYSFTPAKPDDDGMTINYYPFKCGNRTHL